MSDFFLSHFDNPLPIAVLLRAAPGTVGLGGALNRVLQPYANVSYKTRAQFEASAQASVNQLLGLVYVLLALAVVIALIGIVNTLMLSVFERTREIGLLRAVGMKRRQVRSMIRSESVIITLFGGVVGILRGSGAWHRPGLRAAQQRRDHDRRPGAQPDRLRGPVRGPRADRRQLAGAARRESRRVGGDRRAVNVCRRDGLALADAGEFDGAYLPKPPPSAARRGTFGRVCTRSALGFAQAPARPHAPRCLADTPV